MGCFRGSICAIYFDLSVDGYGFKRGSYLCLTGLVIRQSAQSSLFYEFSEGSLGLFMKDFAAKKPELSEKKAFLRPIPPNPKINFFLLRM